MATMDSLHFFVDTCRYGAVSMLATHKGIQSIDLADTVAELQKQVESQGVAFCKSTSTKQAEWWEMLQTYIENPLLPLNVPLDLKGTKFQLEAYVALQRLEPGQTVTYTELAVSMQRPTGARALAGACACNPVALAVPCHRVTGKNGRLTGYRWGLSRKSAILHHEASLTGQFRTHFQDISTNLKLLNWAFSIEKRPRFRESVIFLRNVLEEGNAEMAGLIVLGPLSARGRKNLDQFIAQAGDLYIYGTSYRRRQLWK